MCVIIASNYHIAYCWSFSLYDYVNYLLCCSCICSCFVVGT